MDERTEVFNAMTIRIEKVERQNRWLKYLGLSALMLVAAVMLSGQASPDNNLLEARRFTLRAETGEVRAELGMTSSLPGGKGPCLTLYDEKKNKRAVLSVMEYGPDLVFYDAHGEERAKLVVADGGPRMVLRGTGGKIQVQLAVNADIPWLALFDASEKQRALMVVNDVKGPSFALYDSKGKEMFVRP